MVYRHRPWYPVMPDFPSRQWALASQVSATLSGPPILGLLLDWWLGTTPWCLLGGFALGMATCMTLLMRMSRESKSGDESDKETR